jgi:hypothetical protein
MQHDGRCCLSHALIRTAAEGSHGSGGGLASATGRASADRPPVCSVRHLLWCPTRAAISRTDDCEPFIEVEGQAAVVVNAQWMSPGSPGCQRQRDAKVCQRRLQMAPHTVHERRAHGVVKDQDTIWYVYRAPVAVWQRNNRSLAVAILLGPAPRGRWAISRLVLVSSTASTSPATSDPSR